MARTQLLIASRCWPLPAAGVLQGTALRAAWPAQCVGRFAEAAKRLHSGAVPSVLEQPLGEVQLS